MKQLWSMSRRPASLQEREKVYGKIKISDSHLSFYLTTISGARTSVLMKTASAHNTQHSHHCVTHKKPNH